MWERQLILIYVISLAASETQDQDGEDGYYRKPRFFTFNTNDEEIRLELDFTIPFITIPTKKAMDQFHGMWTGVQSVNINPGSLAIGGAIILVTTVLLPFVLKTYASHYPQQRYSRLIESTQFSTDAMLEFVEKMLADSKAVRGCTLRIACWTAQRSKTDSLRIFHQVMSNGLLSTMINATAIEDAMMTGRKGRDCEVFSPCPLKEQHVPVLLGNLAVFTNSIGQL